MTKKPSSVISQLKPLRPIAPEMTAISSSNIPNDRGEINNERSLVANNTI
jgi:hypothetical protein